MRNLIYGLLSVGALICSEAHTQAQNMNLAGVYEANEKANGGVRQLYAVLDFNTSQAKDFTQLFTGKTAQFQLLPEDFMNVKKLKKRFAGNTSAGFVRYREKFLLAITEELKLTNPRLEAGMIVADWENHSGVKGTCGIIVKEDKSIEFVGLTNLNRDLNPDGLTVACVEDRCLADVPRAKGTPEGVEHFVREYEKRFIKTTVTSCDPEIKVEFKGCEQVGQLVQIHLLITNQSQMEFKMAVDGTESMATDKEGNIYKDITFNFGEQSGNGKANCFMAKATPVKCTVIIPVKNGRVHLFNKVTIRSYGMGSAIFTGNHLQLDNVPVMQSVSVEEEEEFVPNASQPQSPQELVGQLPEKLPNQLIAVVKGGVNLRKGASTTAALAGKAALGEVFAFVGTEGSWNVGISSQTGEKVYIAKSMSKVVDTGVGILNTVFYTSTYANHLNSNPTTGFERNSDYTFWTRQGDKISTVYATFNVNTTTMTGRMSSTSVNYKGQLKGWYIVLDEKVDVGGNLIEKVTPIYVYPDSNEDAVYVNGVKFVAEGI
jgi:hypothetical protein